MAHRDNRNADHFDLWLEASGLSEYEWERSMAWRYSDPYHKDNRPLAADHETCDGDRALIERIHAYLSDKPLRWAWNTERKTSATGATGNSHHNRPVTRRPSRGWSSVAKDTQTTLSFGDR